MIDVSEVVNAEEFAQPFGILRGSGVWNNGVWISQAAPLQGYGVVTVASDTDLEMIPEGDVVKGAMVFHSQAPIFTTNDFEGNGAGGSSDILTWRGRQWRVMTVSEQADYGYYRAIAVRLNAA
jgi:hypothetical protein